VFKAGYHFGETAEVFQTVYKVPPAVFQPGMYRNITGNEAIALGLVVGAELAGKKLFYSAIRSRRRRRSCTRSPSTRTSAR